MRKTDSMFEDLLMLLDRHVAQRNPAKERHAASKGVPQPQQPQYKKNYGVRLAVRRSEPHA